MIAHKIMPGYTTTFNQDFVWEALKNEFKYFTDNNNLIINEAKRLDFKNKYLDGLTDDELISYANMYKLIIPVESENEDISPYIIFFASGGGMNRHIIETFDRAVCRLLLERMNINNMEISIVVS